jgi:hypothetical protein
MQTRGCFDLVVERYGRSLIVSIALSFKKIMKHRCPWIVGAVSPFYSLTVSWARRPR